MYVYNVPVAIWINFPLFLLKQLLFASTYYFGYLFRGREDVNAISLLIEPFSLLLDNTRDPIHMI